MNSRSCAAALCASALCLVAAGCSRWLPSASSGSSTAASTPASAAGSSGIDRRSYNLGIIAAFAEMVGGGVKTLALSDVLSPAEADSLLDEAQEIARRNGAQIYREPDLLVTDLFPESVAQGKQVLLIYRGGTLEAYQQLKADRARLVSEGRYRGQARQQIARRFGRLLSYPDSRIDELLQNKSR